MSKCNYCGSENNAGKRDCYFCGELLDLTVAKSGKDSGSKPLGATSYAKELSGATKTILASADYMDVQQLINLGKAFYNGVGQEQNYSASYKLFHKAATKGSAEAMFYVAEHIAKGLCAQADIKSAIWWYLQAARAGNPQAKFVLVESSSVELPMKQEAEITSGDSTLKNVVASVKPFCVEIFGVSNKRDSCSGSGCIISSEYIITNYHVVASEESGKLHEVVSMRFHPSLKDKRLHLLKVVKYDEKEDIAVCTFADGTKIDSKDFPKLVDAHSLDLGDLVFTIGNTVGQGLALSTGVVAKEVERHESNTQPYETIRIDMTINSGNSGGALFDYEGNIRGIITAMLLESDGKNKSYGTCRAITSNTILDKMFQ